MGVVGYATVERSIWTLFDEREVGADGRLVYMALRSGPDSTLVPGVVATGPGKLHDATKLAVARVVRAFGELEAKGFIEVDKARGIVLDLEGITAHYQIGSGSLIRGWLKVWSKLPRSPLLASYLDRVSARCDLSSADVVAALVQVAAAQGIDWRPRGAEDGGGVSPVTVPHDRPPGPSPVTLPPETPPGPSGGTLPRDPPPGDSPRTLGGAPPQALACAGDSARDSNQQSAISENTHSAGAPTREEPPQAAAPVAAAASPLHEQTAAFMAAWGSFYDLEPAETDHAVFARCWTRVRGTAQARRKDPGDYGRALMRAFLELGQTWTNGFTWSASPALFDKHFTAIVAWEGGQRSREKSPAGAPPTLKPASSCRAEDVPGVSERARQLAQRREAADGRS